jgi:ribonuclease P protein component
MLVRKYCLKKRQDFNNVLRNKKSLIGKLIFLKFIKNHLNNSRFGFVVSLKISKRAVIRNKIKRQLREIVRENLLNIKSGFDIVIIAKPEIVDKNYQNIKNDLENLFKIL